MEIPRFALDREADALYVYFKDPNDFAYTIVLLVGKSNTMFNLDINNSDNVIGVEIINVSINTTIKYDVKPSLYETSDRIDVYFSHDRTNLVKENIDLNKAIEQNTTNIKKTHNQLIIYWEDDLIAGFSILN